MEIGDLAQTYHNWYLVCLHDNLANLLYLILTDLSLWSG